MNVRYPALALSLALWSFSPDVCLAQAAQPVAAAELEQRFEELSLWLTEYKRWEEWMVKWGNRVAFNAAGGVITKRPQRPEPPAWLAEDCQSSLSSEGKLAEACAILERWDSIAQLIVQQKTLAGVTAAETEKRTSFLQRVHLSGGWIPAQVPAPKVYLVAGMQVGIVEVGRATLPAVGVGLMAVADGDGGYEWKPATIIGIGYRLASFGFPWVNREANLHFNIARATIHGTGNFPAGLDPSQNLIGLSLTFAKR